MDKHRDKSEFYSRVKAFWLIQNSKLVTNSLNKLSNREVAKPVSSYDFSTLYTNIPLDKLIKILNFIIDFDFNGRTQNKIYVNNCNKINIFVFDINSLKKAEEYLTQCNFSLILFILL